MKWKEAEASNSHLLVLAVSDLWGCLVRGDLFTALACGLDFVPRKQDMKHMNIC